ncbi:SDR family oxidoreductase [Roseomonas sp. SSH11]|uniref:SDR family oxidoreductase n=1 Tax=Pararoseomonas baculiformis TaxID=2820812 RepID=A0ABS4AJU1_9PROT|nr:SDR family oxidoreductase [Pararoseomonas baculiformis]MBP0447291.1 SDR family oxidoreductase [Pararoseomonas baculiformis]
MQNQAEAPGRAVIVTGGSRGIGAAIACRLAAAGYAPCVTYTRDARGAAEVVARIEASGGRAAALQADSTCGADIARLFDAAEAAFGPLHALVNNAGITGPLGRFADLDEAEMRRVAEVNLLGTMLCAREALRRFAMRPERPGRSVVNISSVAASTGSPGEYVHYAATKAAVEAFTLGLAREVAEQGIRVNAVAPGTVETGIHAAAGDPGRPARIAPRVPMRRVGQPEEVAEAVLWLVSDAASYTTGAVLRVTGGL